VIRWRSCLVGGVGFLLAFGGTAIFGYLGQNPSWLWLLLVLFGLWVWQLPDLKSLDPRLTAVGSYALPFVFLWLASNPEPSGTIKTFVYQMVLSGVGLAALLCLLGAVSYYQRQPALRKSLGGLAPLFLCCWLVAFFSSSTGAARHMIDLLMNVLGMNRSDAQTAALIFRKSMHFLFYGTLGFLGYRAAVRGGVTGKAVVLGLAVALMHASFDEIRQSGYADRTGSFWDVCLDMAGATCFVVTASALGKKALRKERAEAT
jgi:VanZ family protein